MLFRDRMHAGQVLARKLRQYANRSDVLVLGLPRGGVPVAYEVAREIDAPLDVFLVRKLGVPHHRELAMGAIASGGVRVLNEDVVNSLRVKQKAIDRVAAEEDKELKRREQAYRGNLPPLDLRDRTVILVDDGLATGASMHVAAIAARQQHPAKLIAAVPVGAPETCDRFRMEVDEIICAETPDPFLAVGVWYDNFSQTTDAEVRKLLDRASHQQPATSRR
ncbi:phosphoribosyltransferase [Phormidium sp. CCY1219]|uniref:phosphoribosyltransferase n=1 Tax=Phormidium sp. CCY1219 TaxID=2886104 RepID=UPI002D1EE831|nr:phosphoribosyltransferase [Phormidium sp. CCY1219]MEB3830896.1 phosphoribosyltransferase [Phormidium sp. CCY1219]